MQVFQGRNVNDVFDHFLYMATNDSQAHGWRTVAPRGQTTMEYVVPVASTYEYPMERVLFHPERDANPFFHFFEALWILAGREDVAFLKQFNSNIAQYSDDGKVFHAPYGYRLRKYFAAGEGSKPLDQITTAIKMLRADHDTRQVVLSIWDPTYDLGFIAKDIPCNDLIFLKVRDEKLEMRVCCRSNDAVWGCYGANVVQFSTLQEFIAGAVGVGVGPYTQISDSLHVYMDRPDWEKLKAAPRAPRDPYSEGDVSVQPYSMWNGIDRDYERWFSELDLFMKYAMPEQTLPKTFEYSIPYIQDVAVPMLRAWRCWKSEFSDKNNRIARAVHVLERECLADDWALAGKRWLQRRVEA
jgi:thymidylate synthase